MYLLVEPPGHYPRTLPPSYRRGHYLQAVHLYLLLEPRGHYPPDTTPKLYICFYCTDVDTTPGHYPRTLPQPVFVFILATCICFYFGNLYLPTRTPYPVVFRSFPACVHIRPPHRGPPARERSVRVLEFRFFRRIWRKRRGGRIKSIFVCPISLKSIFYFMPPRIFKETGKIFCSPWWDCVPRLPPDLKTTGM
jgi:hypothetical protein